MNRRDFIKLSSATSLALSLEGLPIHVQAQNTADKKTRNTNGKILVLVRLSGGNDGLNTVIPLDQYSTLSTARGNILVPSTNVLPLNNFSNTGLHPAMTGLQSMFNANKVNIVQGVSYPNPDYSHFRASDIYSSAADANLFLNSGWIGRFLDNQFPGAPAAYPSSSFLDPLSIEIGSVTSSVLVGSQGLNGFTISDIDTFYNIVNGTVDPAPNTRGGNELTYVRFIAQQTQAYNIRIQNAALAGSNAVVYPTGNDLASQLKIVAKLISGGLQTPVYIVTIDGFDTHSNQVDAANHAIGYHADLLTELSTAIHTFQQDIEAQNFANKVVGMTFSEFGRRIIANASSGTDHGESAPMIVFGTSVNPSIIGNNPTIPANATVYDNLPMQHDFRQIYSTVLTDWFGLSNTAVNSIMNGNNYQWLPIFSNAVLPIALKNFTAVENDCEVTISWETGEELNVDYFDVLYGSDKEEFKNISRVSAKGSDSIYQIKHTPQDGYAYYKLKVVDKNGQVSFSQVVSLSYKCNQGTVHVYPNPADTVLHIDVKGEKGLVMFALIDSNGRMVKTIVNNNMNSIVDTSKIPSGIYSLVMTNADQRKSFFKVVVKH
jgi:uncharacterized protein (DUF1501 family)